MVPLITVILRGTITYPSIIERKLMAVLQDCLKQLYLTLKDVLQPIEKNL